MRLLPIAAGIAALSIAFPLAAQDPTPPPGGFPVGFVEYSPATPNGPIRWIDGVRTAMDVYHPIYAAPPSSGWPTVLVVHGGSSSRKSRAVRRIANRLAARGYVCFAYDVRGDGITTSLNPAGFAKSDEDQLRDMADAVRLGPTLLPAGVTMDAARLAVTGDSQGGRHSLRAAGWSGQPLPVPVGALTHMPVFSAVAPRIAPLDPIGDNVPDPELANAYVVGKLYGDLPRNDPIVQAILAEDWSTFRALAAANPLRDYRAMVRNSTVPIQVGWAYEDAKHALYPNLDQLRNLSSGPVRLLLSTGGHSTPQNLGEEEFTYDQIGAWFDRWSKGRNNGADRPDVRVQVAWRSADANRHTDVRSDWPHARFASWPPANATPQTLFLRAGGRLLDLAPVVTEPGFTLQHRVLTPGYDCEDFCRQNRRLPLLLQDLGLNEHRFDGSPLPDGLAIAGRCEVVLEQATALADHQVTASLEAVAPDDSVVQISSGTVGRRGNTSPGRITLWIDDVAFRVPAGHRLRLVIRNLAIHEPPGNRFLRWVPKFADYDVQVPIGPTAAPRLVLPVVDPFPASLSPRLDAISASAPTGIVHRMWLEAGNARTGAPYVVLMSAAGTSPGFALPGTSVPLNPDAWTSLAAAAAPFRPFTAFAGLVGLRGEARPTFDLGANPLIVNLVGQRFAFVAGGPEPNGTTFWATDAAELVILP